MTLPARHNLLVGDAGPHVRRMAGPILLGLVALTVFGLVDTFFIGKLGTKYLAAFGFALPVMMFFMGIVFGLAVGTTSVLSRTLGSGDGEKMRQMALDALTLATLLLTAAAVAGYLFTGPVFRLMGAGAEVMPLIRDFMVVWYVGLPFFGLMVVGNACIRATGDTKLPALVMTLSAVIQIVIDPFLIFGWMGAPRLEMTGAAWTLTISYVICAWLNWHFLLRRRGVVQGRLLHPELLAHWRRFLHVAFPNILSNQISPVSAAVITRMASGFGREAVAALGVANRIENVAVIFFYAIATATAIFSGQNYGAGNHGRVREAVSAASRYAMAWGLIVAAGLWVFGGRLAALFDANPAVIEFTTQYLHWVPVTYGAFGAMIISNAALNAMGRPLPATVLLFLRAVVLYVPLAWLLQQYYGFTGILVALALTNAAVGLLSYLWNRKVAS